MLRHFVSSETKLAGLLGTQTRPQRNYHSKKGVWGYRPIAKRVFEGRQQQQQ